MKIKKKWGWTKKNILRYYRKIHINNHMTLYKIYDDDYVWDKLYNMIFTNKISYGSIPSVFKKISNKKTRLYNKKELKKLMNSSKKDDTFKLYKKDIKWWYY